ETPARSTATSTSRGPGRGTLAVTSFKTSGPPGRATSMRSVSMRRTCAPGALRGSALRAEWICMDAQPPIAWSDLQLLLAVAADRSLLAAARRLGVDASTMSRRMTRLEESLRGLVRVTAGAGFGEWLVPIVDDFLRAHPQAAVDLALEERVADLARFEA